MLEQNAPTTDDMDATMDVNTHVLEQLNDSMLNEIDASHEHDYNLPALIANAVNTYAMLMYQMFPPP